MSRVERKKTEKKSNRYFKILIFMEIILLIGTLLFVDLQVRGMLGIHESRLLGYHSLGNSQYTVDLLGGSYLLDMTTVQNYLENLFADFGEIAYNIKDWFENTLWEIIQ